MTAVWGSKSRHKLIMGKVIFNKDGMCSLGDKLNKMLAHSTRSKFGFLPLAMVAFIKLMESSVNWDLIASLASVMTLINWAIFRNKRIS